MTACGLISPKKNPGRHGLEPFRLTNTLRGTIKGTSQPIIFSELTVNVAVSCVDDPMVELNESRLSNFVSLVMPMTSTL